MADASGQLAVLLEDGESLYVAVHAAGGWSEPVLVATEFDVDGARLAINAAGQAVVAWSAGEDDFVAVAHLREETWSDPEMVFTSDKSGPEGLGVGLASDGEATLVWVDRQRGPTLYRTT
jgi:hypothetical protein